MVIYGNVEPTLGLTAGWACNSVGSKAEPWNQWVAFGEKVSLFQKPSDSRRLFLAVVTGEAD